MYLCVRLKLHHGIVSSVEEILCYGRSFKTKVKLFKFNQRAEILIPFIRAV